MTKLSVKVKSLLIQSGVSVILLCGITIVIAGFIPLHGPVITGWTVAALLKAGADSCMVERVELTAWKSITIENGTIYKRIDSLRAVRFFCEDARISFNLLSLLLNRREIRRQLYSGNTALLDLFCRQPDKAYERLCALWHAIVKDGTGDFSGIGFTGTKGTKEIARGVNGTLNLVHNGRQPENIGIKLQLPTLNIAGDGLQNLRCTAVAASGAHVEIENLTGSYFDGKLKGKAILDFMRNRIESYDCSIEKMDMAYWYTVHVGIGEITGKCSIHAQGRTSPMQLPLNEADIAVTLHQCRVTKLPVQQALATSMFIPSLSSIDFSRITIDASVNSADTVFTTFTGTGEQLDFTSKGWVTAGGYLQQQFEGVFSKRMVDSFPNVVKKTLEPAGNGKRQFQCRLYGTYTDPLFELDEATLRRAVGNMFDDLRQSVFETLRGN